MQHPTIIPARAPHGRLALTEAELVHWGEGLGRAATAPLVVTVTGDLGTGKTTLVRAICQGYGVTEEVTSPTFALVHQYDADRSRVYHLDLYRLEGPQDLPNLGWDDIVGDHALVIIEWPERAGELLPHNHLPIELAHLPDDPSRRLLYAGGHVTDGASGGGE